MALPSSSFRKAVQQLFPAVGDFSYRMWLLLSMLKRRRLTATYSFTWALALPLLVARPLCSRGAANIVEEGVPDSDLIVLHLRVGSGLFPRCARNSSHLFGRASSVSLRVGAQVFKYSARLPVLFRRRALRFLIASRSSRIDTGLVHRPALDLPT